MNTIAGFHGEYRWLSNFWPAIVAFEGLIYPTVEHAYQAAKTLDRAKREEIAATVSPGTAKRLGRRLIVRGDWEKSFPVIHRKKGQPHFATCKLQTMETLLRKKFAHPDLGQLLLDTGDAQIIEQNYWGDEFWGVCNGRGHNHLGVLLMRIRDELRDGT